MYRFLRRRGKRRDLNVLLKELWLERDTEGPLEKGEVSYASTEKEGDGVSHS